MVRAGPRGRFFVHGSLSSRRTSVTIAGQPTLACHSLMATYREVFPMNGRLSRYFSSANIDRKFKPRSPNSTEPCATAAGSCLGSENFVDSAPQRRARTCSGIARILNTTLESQIPDLPQRVSTQAPHDDYCIQGRPHLLPVSCRFRVCPTGASPPLGGE